MDWTNDQEPTGDAQGVNPEPANSPSPSLTYSDAATSFAASDAATGASAPSAGPETTTSPKVPLLRRSVTVSSVLAVAVLVAAVGGGGFLLGHDLTSKSVPAPGSKLALPNLPSGGFGFNDEPSSATSAAAAKVAALVDPGLVDITTNLSYQGSSAAGTGMILTPNGMVLTNNHVIARATSITARVVATNQTFRARVVGYDVSGDVALIKLENASGLTPVTTASSAHVSAQEKIVGVGNAGGVGGTPSAVTGNVVALNQSINASDPGSANGSESLSHMIEVNADIQPGDSGGAIVTTKGHVIGMITAGSNGGGFVGFGNVNAPTQGYAIPISAALKIVSAIESGPTTASVHVGKTAFLGIEVLPALTGTAQGAVTPGAANGVTIDTTIPGTAARASGLTSGDVITSLNGQSVANITDLQKIVELLHPGDVARVGYLTPSGTSATVSLTLGAGPPQ